jgi:hypothetical protein
MVARDGSQLYATLLQIPLGSMFLDPRGKTHSRVRCLSAGRVGEAAAIMRRGSSTLPIHHETRVLLEALFSPKAQVLSPRSAEESFGAAARLGAGRSGTASAQHHRYERRPPRKDVEWTHSSKPRGAVSTTCPTPIPEPCLSDDNVWSSAVAVSGHHRSPQHRAGLGCARSENRVVL